MNMEITKKLKKKRGAGPYYKTVPEGESITSIVQSSMITGKGSSKERAVAVGVGAKNYILIRKLLIIKGKRVLTDDEDKEVSRALQILEDSRGGEYKLAEALTTHIVSRYWIKDTATGELRGDLARPAARIKRRFDSTIFAVREVCSNSKRAEVPAVMTAVERKEAMDVLADSIHSLWNLFYKIRGETND